MHYGAMKVFSKNFYSNQAFDQSTRPAILLNSSLRRPWADEDGQSNLKEKSSCSSGLTVST